MEVRMAVIWLVTSCLAAIYAQYVEDQSTKVPSRKLQGHNHHHEHRNGFILDNMSSGRNPYETRTRNSQVEMIKPANGTRKIQDFGQMVFPGQEFQRQTTGAADTKTCLYGLCENVSGYPTDKVQNLLNRSPELKEFFKQQAINATEIEIGNRGQFDVDDGETFCATRSHISFPQTAFNLDNVERTVVNVNETKQGIVYETCVDEGKSCRYADVFSEEMYVTTCKQKYSVRTLLILGQDHKDLKWDNFKIPSCCLCHIKRV